MSVYVSLQSGSLISTGCMRSFYFPASSRRLSTLRRLLHAPRWLVIDNLDVYGLVSLPGGSAVVLEELKLDSNVTIFGVAGRSLFRVGRNP